MSRRTLINIIQNVFQPSVNQAMEADLIGAEMKQLSVGAETTITLDFGEYKFHEVTLGSANITALNAIVTGLKPGERVYLKLIQDGTGARTVAWGTGILTDITVSSSTDDIDLYVGVFDGTNIILGALAQNAV